MISINTSKISSVESALERDINSTNSILIIGRAENEYNLNEIYRPTGISDMVERFGYSELTTAYTDAVNLGANNVYVLNAFKTTDYIDCINNVIHYNFSYIVPVGIKLSDTFYSNELNNSCNFCIYYLEKISMYSNSIIIFTDEHAKLYENINDFLEDMHNKVFLLKENNDFILNEFGRNFLFSLNNISSYKFSNVALATKLSLSTCGKYPTDIPLETVFNLDRIDVPRKDIVFFKSNILRGTTIENLYNFRNIDDAVKFVPIDLVIKYIERNMDLSFVLGKHFNHYIEANVKDYVETFMTKMVGRNIQSYNLDNISLSYDDSRKLTYLNLYLTIKPYNSLENIEVKVEVS